MRASFAPLASDRLTFVFEGREIEGRKGETVAAALTAAGILSIRRTRNGSARGLFCGMGVCQDTFLAAAWANQRTLRFADGPDEVHMDQIARLELRKHREPS